MNDADDRRPGRLALLLAGIVASTMVLGLWVTWFAADRTERSQVWAELGEQGREDLLVSHLRLVEWLGGDEAVDVQADIVDPVQESASLCRVLAEGGQFDGVEVAPFGPLPVDGSLDTACADLDRLVELTIGRVRAPTTSQAGTPADQAYDEAFETALADADALASVVSATRNASRVTVSRVGVALSLALGLLLAGIVAVGRLHSRSLGQLGRRNEIVLAAAGEGIAGVDHDGRLLFANPAAARLLGRDGEELDGADVHHLLHRGPDGSEDHPGSACPVLASLRQGGVAHAQEGEFCRADGTNFPAEFTATTVADVDAVTGGVIVFRDITDRRAMEELKDQFVSMVSHELRTPLTSIHGSLGLLAGGALGDMPSSAQRMLEIATTNTDRLVRLINDILDIERMRSGEIRMEREVIDLDPVVVAATASMQGMADEAGVDLTVSSEPVLVWADGDRITQVVVNLVGNAIKFSESGGPVTVELQLDGSSAMLSVMDRGRGIPEDQLGRVFGRFQQVDASDARVKGGTGLGLAISESIVTHHDGRIWAERRPGGGTAVRFVVPAVRRHEAVAGPGATVLVVDDDPSVLEVVCRILEREGYHAVPAATGDEAIRISRADPPEAVVLDLLMPSTNGWQVLGALRDNPETADVPVVILSALSESDETLALDHYEGWIDKPFDDETLIAALTRAMEPRTDRIRAVIVEDDLDLAEVLIATFARHDIDASHAATAQQARAMVPGIEPDLIVIDLRLPDGDGVDVLHDLRAAGHLRGVPVVVYTGYDVEPEDRDRLDRDGAIVFTKTLVSPEDFERRVLQLIGALVEPPSRIGA